MPLLDVDDMVMMKKPDWKCVFTYVQSLYKRLKDEWWNKTKIERNWTPSRPFRFGELELRLEWKICASTLFFFFFLSSSSDHRVTFVNLHFMLDCVKWGAKNLQIHRTETWSNVPTRTKSIDSFSLNA